MLIKELRKITGLSQSQFAHKFHIPIGTLAHWEQEVRTPPEYVIYMITKIVYMEKHRETPFEITVPEDTVHLESNIVK